MKGASRLDVINMCRKLEEYRPSHLLKIRYHLKIHIGGNRCEKAQQFLLHMGELFNNVNEFIGSYGESLF